MKSYYLKVQNNKLLYLGKFTPGWRFCACRYPGYDSFDKYKILLNKGIICDEYNKKIQKAEFLEKIYNNKNNLAYCGEHVIDWGICDSYNYKYLWKNKYK